MSPDDEKFWKEQEKSCIRLYNCVKHYKDPFVLFKDKYSHIDAANSTYWLEHKGTSYDRLVFPYELPLKKLGRMVTMALEKYNRDGKKKDILLLLQTSVDQNKNIRSQDHFGQCGVPCMIHVINLTETYNFKSWYKHLLNGKEWPWTGTQVVNHQGVDHENGCLSINPREGKLIWNSSDYCSSLQDRNSKK